MTSKVLRPVWAMCGVVFAWLLVLPTPVASTPAGTVDVTLISPEAGDIIHEEVEVWVEVTSTFELDTVVADIEGRTANLAYTGSGDTWTGTVDTTGFAWGPKSYTVTATDVFANQGSETAQLQFDLPPVVTVITPMDFDTVSRTFRVQATCTDDGPNPCTRTELTNASWNTCASGSITGTAGPVLDKIADLGPFMQHGQNRNTCVRGWDDAGQISGKLVHLWLIESDAMSEVDEASGLILDVTESQLLFHGAVASGGFGEPIGVRDRATGAETIVFDDRNIALEFKPEAKLSSFGLLAEVRELDGGWKSRIYDWRTDGTLFELDISALFSEVKVNGGWATWVRRLSGAANYEFVRRDLATESYEVLPDVFSGTQLLDDGRLFYFDNTKTLKVDDGGAVTPLLAGDPGILYGPPLTDGGLIYYSKRDATEGTPREYTLAELDNGVETEFAGPFETPFSLVLRHAGGWVAWEQSGATGQRHVWRRGPGGVPEQLTFFSDNSFLKSVSSKGDVIYGHDGLEFLVVPYSSSPVDLGAGTPESFWLNNRLFRAYGRKLHEVKIEFLADGFESGDFTAWSSTTP